MAAPRRAFYRVFLDTGDGPEYFGLYLRWVPWDHNMSLSGTMGLAPPLPLDMHSVDEQWPLIRRLMDDPVYRARYWAEVVAFADGPFSRQEMEQRLTAEHHLIAPYMVGPEGERPQHTALSDPAAFEPSLSELVDHVTARHAAVAAALPQP